MPRHKQGEAYSTTYQAQYMRQKRQQMVDKDPIALRKTVWVINTQNGQQIVFKDRKDITITRIPKQQMKTDCIKAF